MSTDKTFTEKVAAPGASAGFDYQYYYFLYQLLNLKKGQSVGLEIKDDVHTDLGDDVQLLFQLKHTIQKQADKSPIALTELDLDLWKTLSNWSKIITDPNDDRATENKQIALIKKTEFHLVTNKSKSKTNKTCLLIGEYNETGEPERLSQLLTHLKSLKTADQTIREYIDDVINLKKEYTKNLSKTYILRARRNRNN